MNVHLAKSINIMESGKVYLTRPFYRYLGIQEPASVLFSLLNLQAHYKGLKRFNSLNANHRTIRPLTLVYGFSAINLWVWSLIFHTRDFPFTEKVAFQTHLDGLL